MDAKQFPTSFGSQSNVCGRKFKIGLIVGVVIVAAIVGVAVGVPLSNKEDDSTTNTPATSLERAVAVLESFPLVDGHNDLSWQYKKNADNKVYEVDLTKDLRLIWNISHTDIPRLRQGKLGAQFWAVYCSCQAQYKDAVRQMIEQADTIKKFVNKYPDTFTFVTTAKGILDSFKNGRIGSLLGLEGGHALDSSLATLRMFYEIGVRYMTVTHSCNTPWADNWNVDVDNNPEHNGLTAFGKTVIREMNRLGMLVDLSHASHKTMVDTLQVAESPVIFSHSSAYHVCNHYRNVQDDVLIMTKENNGVVMVNFYDKYINCYPNNQTEATLGQVADHIEYIKDFIGVDYVGIGADYDGVKTLPTGLEDVSTFPALFSELIDRGWSDTDLEKLAGRNLIRVLEANEEVSRQKAGLPPYEDVIQESSLKNTSCRTELPL